MYSQATIPSIFLFATLLSIAFCADIDFALICDKGYRVSAIKRAKTAYSLLGSLTVECEQIALGESTNCAPQQSVPKCTGLLEGCTGNTWLGGFHVYLLENTTQAAVLDPVCCSSPSVQIDSGSCINDQLNTGTHDFSHSIVADLVYRGWQCWHQYDKKAKLVDLLWKTEICPFQSSDFPVITRKTDCEECSCECGIEQCSNGASPVKIHPASNMVIPTLFQLASKAVAQGIDDRKIKMKFILDTESSNAVFRELLNLYPEHIRSLKELRNRLKVDKMDLRKCRIDKEDVPNIQTSNLRSLTLGELSQLRDEFPDWYDGSNKSINIVRLLHRLMNRNSRKMMTHLGISGKQEFGMSWEKHITKLLPNLLSIEISSKIFHERFQFSKFCIAFPNLQVLDISFTTGLTNLKGIKQLKNLQKLTMRDVRLKDKEDGYRELSELKHLKYLDVSSKIKPTGYAYNPHRIIAALLADKVRMQSLEFVNCSMTSVMEHELRGFIQNHPKLEAVVAIDTECEKGSIHEINVLNNSSVENIIKSLEYTLLTNNEALSKHCMFHIFKLFESDHEKLQDSEIDDCLKTLCHVLRHGSKENSVVKYSAFHIFAEAKFFETNRFIAFFSSEVPAITTLFYRTGRSMKYKWVTKYVFPLLVKIFERTVNSVTLGRLIPTKHLNFLMEETISMIADRHATPRQGLRILEKSDRLMSWEQYQVISRDSEMIVKLFKLVDDSHFYYYERIIDLASKFMQKGNSDDYDYNYVRKFNLVLQYFKEVPQLRVLKVLRHLTGMMSENQLKECYTEEVLENLIAYQIAKKLHFCS
ncbi:Protein CBG11124 [Caenorhabditis briggsae]|uniref:Protein CBG11124 n=1 Tax=Caenorhabditis briggsae TaxID=6238 RepID=A8XCG6_CAEBR|nr:Protein CBG11124 [Caenorhabditis briggsae]CAP30333.1 Protein CBG11124 [Caenorhabditis briggsae]